MQILNNWGYFIKLYFYMVCFKNSIFPLFQMENCPEYAFSVAPYASPRSRVWGTHPFLPLRIPAPNSFWRAVEPVTGGSELAVHVQVKTPPVGTGVRGFFVFPLFGSFVMKGVQWICICMCEPYFPKQLQCVCSLRSDPRYEFCFHNACLSRT